MNYDLWRTYYTKILDDLGFSASDDADATALLAQLVAGRELATVGELAEMLHCRHVYIFGAGASLEHAVGNGTLAQIDFSDSVVIAVDGATSILLRSGITPAIIVTDLDGAVDDQITANRAGAIAVIHAHGHNRDILSRYVPQFPGKIMATTQTTPVKNVHNFCGFADGDRAVFLAHFFMARSATLIGFDFDGEATACSPSASPVKAKKMLWSKELIESVKTDQESTMAIEIM